MQYLIYLQVIFLLKLKPTFRVDFQLPRLITGWYTVFGPRQLSPVITSTRLSDRSCDVHTCDFHTISGIHTLLQIAWGSWLYAQIQGALQSGLSHQLMSLTESAIPSFFKCILNYCVQQGPLSFGDSGCFMMSYNWIYMNIQFVFSVHKVAFIWVCVKTYYYQC